MIQRVTLIGAGNLATHLGKVFRKAGIQIVQVYSKTLDSASTLGKILDTAFTDVTKEIDLTADLILVSVKDDAIEQVLDQLKLRQQLIVHTAGSIPMDFLKKYSAQCGVFYPLQTFSKGKEIDFSDIPICIEANSAEVLNELRELAGEISDAVYEISSEERKVLHLAAVFACNFVNHFYYISGQLLEKEGLAFDLLKPLIRETAAKVMSMDPYEAQTGPAKRLDETIINKHLELMDNQPEFREIYSFVSRSIFEAHKK
jgi:predicted short-subunit dehydrogenase-like oxidoreductase (DUF2520 family)